MSVAPPEALSPVQRLSEHPPMPIGYSSPIPAARPVRRLWAAVVALAAGVVLLGIALYALLSVSSTLTAPQAQAYERVARELMPAMLGMFAAICTVTALVFLGVGLKWLGAVSRAVG